MSVVSIRRKSLCGNMRLCGYFQLCLEFIASLYHDPAARKQVRVLFDDLNTGFIFGIEGK